MGTDIVSKRTPGPMLVHEFEDYVTVGTEDEVDLFPIGTPNRQTRADAAWLAMAANTYDELLAVAEAAREQPDRASDILRRAGVVIDKWPVADRAPGPWTAEELAALDPEVRWQGVAFTLYTELVLGPVSSAVRSLDEVLDAAIEREKEGDRE